jgi:hypothetical protein
MKPGSFEHRFPDKIIAIPYRLLGADRPARLVVDDLTTSEPTGSTQVIAVGAPRE